MNKQKKRILIVFIGLCCAQFTPEDGIYEKFTPRKTGFDEEGRSLFFYAQSLSVVDETEERSCLFEREGPCSGNIGGLFRQLPKQTIVDFNHITNQQSCDDTAFTDAFQLSNQEEINDGS